MGMVDALMIKLLLFIIVEIALAYILYARIRGQSTSTTDNNIPADSTTEVRIEKSEIMNRFYDYQMDAFLRRTFKGLESWNPVHEDRVGFHWEGLHVVTCRMLDGNRFDVSVYVQPDHITPELYEQQVEQETVSSCEDIAAAWMAEWNTEFAAHATQGTGFSIPFDQLPPEEEVQELIIDHIIMQGDFSVQRDEEDHCIRFAYNMAAL